MNEQNSASKNEALDLPSSPRSDLSVKSSALNVERSGSTVAVDADNPWPGLAPFTEEQSAFFYGRDEEIRALTRLMERKALTVLFGQSGLGKSSLLQAGVFPRLRAANFCPVYIRLDHSHGAASPTEQVKAIVLRAIRSDERQRVDTAAKGPLAGARGYETNTESLWEFFHHRDDRLVDAGGRTIVPVLVLDQFEELFTLGAAAGAERDRAVAFMSELAELVENRPSEKLVERLEQSADEMDAFDFGRTDYRVCISLREDYLPHLEGLKTIMPALMENRMRLTRMSGTQALEAVIKPGGRLVTAEVARTIVEFVSGARGGSAERLAELDVEPPLLSVICRELNERRRALRQPQITADLVTGNRREILTDFYERSVADLPEAMRRFVEDKLLTKSGFRDNLALETALEEPGVTKPLIDTLVARRLLRIEDRIGSQRVELTHDVLADVVKASRDARQQRLLLQQAQERERLALAAEQRKARRMRFAIAALVAAVLALSVGAVFGIRAQRQSAAQASRTDFILGSRLLDDGRISEGIAYLVRAGQKDPQNPVVAPRLLTSLAATNFGLPVEPPLQLPSPAVWAEYTADGQRLLLQSQDGSVSILTTDPWRVERTVQLGGPIRFGGCRLAARNSAVFAVALADNTLHVCDLATGKSRLAVKPGERLAGRVPVFELSPDGRWLAARSPTRLWIWDATTGEEKFTHPIDASTTYPYLTFSPEGDRLVFPIGGRANLVSVPDGKFIGQPMFHSLTQGLAFCFFARFSGDGRRLLLRYSVGISIYDASTGERLYGPIASPGADEAFLNQDGTRLTYVAADRSVQVLDLASGKPVYPGLPHGARIQSARPDARRRLMVTSTVDGLVRFWDLETGKLAAEPMFKQNEFVPTALAPDGRTAAMFARSGLAAQFRLGHGATAPLTLPRDLDVRLVNLHPAPPTRTLWLKDTAITALDAATGRETQGGYPMPSRITGPATIRSSYGQVLGKGQSLVVQTDAEPAKRWRAFILGHDGVEREVVLNDVPDSVSYFLLESDCYLAATVPTGAGVRDISIWDLRTGKMLSVVKPEKAISGGQTLVSPDERNFAYRTSEDAVIHVCDVATGKERFALQLTGHASLASFRFSANGRHLLTGDDWGSLHVWDMQTGQVVQSRQTHRAGITRFDISRDRRYYASLAEDGTLQVWNMETHAPIGALLTHPGTLSRADFSPDGSRIATAGSTSLRVWDVATGHALTPSLEHEGQRASLAAYGPDGKFVQTYALAANTRTIWIWAAPPDGHGQPTPGWLLDLATICAGQRVMEDGRFVPLDAAYAKIETVRRTVAELPSTDAYGEWGRWLLLNDPARPIAPGFAVTPAEAKALREKRETAAASIAAETERDRVLQERASQALGEQKWVEAAAAIRERIEWLQARNRLQTREAAAPYFNLSRALLEQGKVDEAETAFLLCQPLIERYLPAAKPTIERLRGRILLGQQRYAEAEPLLLAGYEALKSSSPNAYAALREIAQALANLYRATNAPAKADQWQKIADDAREPVRAGKSPQQPAKRGKAAGR